LKLGYINLRRAILAWLLIAFAETINGTIRELFITPAIGQQPAHQVGFLIAIVLILFIAWLTAPWIKAETFKTQLAVGFLWLVLMLVFEFGLGYILGFSWEYLLADYNLASGGLMSYGLAIMLLAPAFGAWLQNKIATKSK
jgi:hypothetical protein